MCLGDKTYSHAINNTILESITYKINMSLQLIVKKKTLSTSTNFMLHQEHCTLHNLCILFNGEHKICHLLYRNVGRYLTEQKFYARKEV